MSTVAESNVLLREEAEMPSGFKVATQELYQGWKLMRSGGVRRLAKKIQTRGWSFTPTADGLPRSGVGKTSDEAIESALTQVLQRVGTDSDAIEVERIELTQYPWFYLARVCVHPYRIQQDGAQSQVAQTLRNTASAASNRPGQLSSDEGYLRTQSAMPKLKSLLTVPGRRTAQA